MVKPSDMDPPDDEVQSRNPGAFSVFSMVRQTPFPGPPGRSDDQGEFSPFPGLATFLARMPTPIRNGSGWIPPLDRSLRGQRANG